MSSNADWQELILDEAAAEVTVGYVGPMADKYVASGIPFLRSLNIEPYRLNLQDLAYITEGFHQQLKKSALSPGDVVIVRTGKPGTAAVIPESLPVANCSDLVVIRPGTKLAPRFLVYYINSLAQHHVSAYTVGAVQQHFNISSAKAMKLHLPPLWEQEAIARVLGALDDKIELNRRMNRALEAMAAAIFKSWFVDFDPVVAKAGGRAPYGMNADTAALFPAAFQDSEIDPIPKGWKASTIGDEFGLVMGQSPPGTTYNEDGDGTPFFQGRMDFGFRFPTRRVYCTAPTRFANPGDTLVSVRAPVGDINMAAERCSIGRGVAAIRHKRGSRSYTYYAMHFLSDEFSIFEGEGTLFGSIGGKDFRSIKVVAPDPQIVAAFERKIFSLDQRIENNERQSRTLAAIRDALLPKLLSGEIRVKQAERIVEDAV